MQKAQKEIHGMVLMNCKAVLVLAGAETSATTLSGTTYLLLKHPAVMERLTKEI